MHSDLLIIGRNTIAKEAQALSAFVDQLGENFVSSCETIFECRGTVLLTGMGKSGLVARKWSSTFSSTGTRSYFINPAEAPHGDLGILHPEDVLIALSYSGETEELSFILRHARDVGIKTIGVTGNIASSLARQVSIPLSVSVPEEACPLGLAPTTSTTLMMALGDAVAVTLMKMRGFKEEEFARLHPGGSLGRRLWLRVRELMHEGERIPIIAPEAPLERVLLEMTRKCLGLAVVMEQDKVLGIVTDGDLRRYFQSHAVSATTRAKDLMTLAPKRISDTATAVEAREMMEQNSIQQLLVVDPAEKLVGVIHLHDLLRAKVV